MSKLLVKLFIKNYQDTKNPSVREKYGYLGSITGIIVNILLACGKYLIGVLTNSIAITADAVNNLSDSVSCIITLVSFKMANMKPDKEHPFGHGRIEYVAALIVLIVFSFYYKYSHKTNYVSQLAVPYVGFFFIGALVQTRRFLARVAAT